MEVEVPGKFGMVALRQTGERIAYQTKPGQMCRVLFGFSGLSGFLPAQ